MFDLTGKRALVTGASGGIGREIAKALASHGAARRAQRHPRVGALEETQQQMGGSDHPILPCNLSDLDAVDKLVPAAEAALGGIDILVNNAGITRDNLFMRMKDEEWDEVHRGQPHFRLPPDPRRAARHDEAALRPHHRHHLGGRRRRQSGAGQLRGRPRPA